MLLSEHLPGIGQDLLIDSPLATPLPLIGQPMMTDSLLATPSPALQYEGPEPTAALPAS